MLSQASRQPGLLEALQDFLSDPSLPVWGSCAGMILMAAKEGISGGKKPQKGLDGIPTMRVVRNLYGGELNLLALPTSSELDELLVGQLESFEAPLEIPCLPHGNIPFPGIFIRAPAIHSFLPPPPLAKSLPPLQPLCVLPPDMAATLPHPDTHPWGPAQEDALRIVMLRQGKKLVTSFHPELSPDIRIHEYFVEICLE